MKKNNKFPLIIESHPESYTGYPFITLIKYIDSEFLTIIDNVISNQINAYVIDHCALFKIDESEVVENAYIWYRDHKQHIPISVYFGNIGKSFEYSKILKSFSSEYISRVIGPLYTYNMSTTYKIKKRRKKNFDDYVSKNQKYLVA